MKLAKAASQQLKGIIVEYDVLCSTLVGKSGAQAAQRQTLINPQAQPKKQESSSMLPKVSNMFTSDVRNLLKSLQVDSTGKPWIVKDRLQNTLQGLPLDGKHYRVESRHVWSRAC